MTKKRFNVSIKNGIGEKGDLVRKLLIIIPELSGLKAFLLF